MNETLPQLLTRVRTCARCMDLPLGPRPIVQAHRSARILIAGQAPGKKVHETGVPFNDASGDRLRAWLQMPRAVFYDAKQVALLPMGFCYPGTGTSGDLPPRAECAPAWRAEILTQLKHVELTLVIGQYARAYHLPQARGSLADTVSAWREFAPAFFPLPHPSPRNALWLKRHPWFEREVLPALRKRIETLLAS